MHVNGLKPDDTGKDQCRLNIFHQCLFNSLGVHYSISGFGDVMMEENNGSNWCEKIILSVKRRESQKPKSTE